MRSIRIVLPLLLLSAAACASSAGVEASASTSPAASVQLLNRAEALRLMERYYPPLLHDARVTGEVVLRLTLNADGTVSDEAVLRSTQELFSNAAITVAEQLRFSPPSLAGSRVDVRMQFALGQEADINLVQP